MVKFGKKQWILCLSAVLLICGAVTQRALAYDNRTVISKYYDELAEKLMKTEIGRSFDFPGLRGFYAQSTQYDPLGEETIRTLIKLAESLKQAPDQGREDILFVGYHKMLENHIANIDVALFAKEMALQDPIYGDPAFFDWVIRGLTKAVMDDATGLSLAQAYNIITLGEEQAIFKARGFTVLDKQIYKADRTHYAVYRGINDKTNQEETIFIDMTLPLRFLEEQQKEEKKLILPR